MEFLKSNESYQSEETMEEFTIYSKDQDTMTSFQYFPGVADFIKDVLKAEKDDFPGLLWSNKRRLGATGPARTLMDAIFYILTDFSSNCKQTVSNTNTHERTSFVKYIVPMFKYFSQETNLNKFCRCETGLESREEATMESNDFVVSYPDRRFADALGKNTVTKNEECFIESSSGFDKEKVNHSLDDTLKLIVGAAILYYT